MELLIREPTTARDLSTAVSIPEKEVFAHLEHVGKTARQSGRRLSVSPAVCRKCGYRFERRNRFTKPGKCPSCRGTFIEEPYYFLEESG